MTSVNRPGGNASGVNLLASELLPKRLELLVDLLPQTSRYAAILNPKTLPPNTKGRIWKERVSRWGSHY